jgi:hypothetical protein
VRGSSNTAGWSGVAQFHLRIEHVCSGRAASTLPLRLKKNEATNRSSLSRVHRRWHRVTAFEMFTLLAVEAGLVREDNNGARANEQTA